MSAALLRDLFAYDTWANGRTLDGLGGLPEEIYHRDLKSSHGGLHGTAVHAMFAQSVWLLRWKGEPIDPAYRLAKESTTLTALRTAWEEIDRDTGAYLAANLSDAFLARTFEMKTLKGDVFVHRYGDSMLHLVNHSTYHRGQLAGMMRQMGFTPPGTDYILFARGRA